jgi:polyferredoxin
VSYPYPPAPPADPNRGLRQAGTVAIWVWVLLAVVPLLLIGACVVFCFMGGIYGITHPASDPTIYPTVEVS